MPGLKAILAGKPGAGKTTSARTLARAGIETFMIFTEPHMDRVSGTPGLHWVYIPPVPQDWEALENMAKSVNRLTAKALSEIPISRERHTQFLTLIGVLNQFICECHGQNFGDVAQWGPNRALWLDGLTGVSRMAERLTSGDKPVKTQPDWGIAMQTLQNLHETLVFRLKCWYILAAHIEYERNELTQVLEWTLSTLGRKLAPQLLPPVDLVMLAERRGDKFHFSTASEDFPTKSWHLDLRKDWPQDWGFVVEKWKGLQHQLERKEEKDAVQS